MGWFAHGQGRLPGFTAFLVLLLLFVVLTNRFLRSKKPPVQGREESDAEEPVDTTGSTAPRKPDGGDSRGGS